MEPHRLLESLVEKKFISGQVADQLLSRSEAEIEDILEILEEEFGLDRRQVLETYAFSYGMDYVDLEGFEPDDELLGLLDSSTAQQYFIFPYEQQAGHLKLAVAEPPDLRMVDDLEAILEMPVECSLTDPQLLEELVSSHYGTTLADIESILAELGGDDLIQVEDSAGEADVAELEEQAEEAPVIKLVNMIIMEAVQEGASDIHIEPLEGKLLVRYRIDGVLHKAHEPPKKLQGAVISRIKIMSEMDIAERRTPQDGRIKLKMMGREFDFRVSCLPGIYGESVVLRILDKESVKIGLENLGFLPDNKAIFNQLIRRPNGIILVTGPTGSGKTTTLYSALRELNTPDRKLITIEDPVEYQLDGINQMQVNNEIGLDFSFGLSRLLRQSPDIILVGEIRDYETAETAIRAALTGHLVFSTLHTNDAPSAVNRLIDLGLNPYLISSAVQAIMAQRLVRTICKQCKTEYKPEIDYIRQVGFPEEAVEEFTFYQGAGCEECNMTGYSGRAAIFEMMTSTEEIKQLIMEGCSTAELREAAIDNGMRTLRRDGFIKVMLGQTTLMEIARVTQAHGTTAAI